MKITRKQLRKLVQEMMLIESPAKKAGTASVHSDDLDHVVSNILNPSKHAPAFKFHFDKDTSFDAHFKPGGQVEGKYEFILSDPNTGLELDGTALLEFPGFSDKKHHYETGAQMELIKHLKKNNVDIFLKGELQNEIGLDHGEIKISPLQTSVAFGVKGTLGKGKKGKSKHH